MITFKETLKVWWYIAWRQTLILFGIGFILGVIGADPQGISLLGKILPIPISMWMMYYALNRFYGKKKDDDTSEI